MAGLNPLPKFQRACRADRPPRACLSVSTIATFGTFSSAFFKKNCNPAGKPASPRPRRAGAELARSGRTQRAGRGCGSWGMGRQKRRATAVRSAPKARGWRSQPVHAQPPAPALASRAPPRHGWGRLPKGGEPASHIFSGQIFSRHSGLNKL